MVSKRHIFWDAHFCEVRTQEIKPKSKLLIDIQNRLIFNPRIIERRRKS